MNEDFKKELESLSPNLAKLKAQQSVKKPELPTNFFHNMQIEVLGKLKEEIQPIGQAEKARPTSTWLDFLLKPQISLAFGIGLMLIVAGIFWIKNPVVEKPAFAELSEEEILEYIGENIDDFDAISLSEITDEEIDFDTDFDEEEINQYFEENIDQMDDSDFENLF